jgi:hypothetical protein
MSAFKEERLMQVLLAPQISEKATYIADKNEQVVFRVASDATKPEVKAAVELLFKVEVKAAGCQRQGQGKALWQDDWPPQGLEEGVCLPEAGPGNQLRGRGVSNMALVKVKPTSAGRRAVVKVVSPNLHKGAPVASLVEKQSKTAGRNNNGHITTRHKGGGHKQHYRLVDFRRNKDGIVAKVERLEYDPNRSAHLALLCYADGERRYIIAPKGWWSVRRRQRFRSSDQVR